MNEVVPIGDRKRILLVEGDGFTRLVLLLRLRLAGFIVDFTSNGILGLGKLRHCRPDILLVELKLCGLSGLELIKAARAEPAFGDKPIYVFTHAERMNRSTRKEVGHLATELFDKAVITREDVVQIFTSKFIKTEQLGKQAAVIEAIEEPAAVLNDMVLPGAIQELIAGVREQCEVLARESDARVPNGRELLSRVSSVASCAGAAGLADLERQAQALERFLEQLCNDAKTFADASLDTINRAVEVMSQIASHPPGKAPSLTKFNAVFVDESAPSNQATEQALLAAGFEPVCFEEPGRAREYLGCHKTQLILLNVALPEAHGLAVADIRQFPLHAATPVLLGPDRSVYPLTRDDAPGSAPRLDKAPLCLAELVVKALNEVQSPRAKTNGVAAKSAVEPAPARVLAQPAALPLEDGYELFARATEPAQPPVVAEAAQSPFAAADANQQPTRLNELFNAAGIPNMPFFRVEPGPAAEDTQAPTEVILPTTSTDQSQMEERPLEAFPFASLRAEAPPVPQQEPVAEDQSAPIAWVLGPTNEPGQEILAASTPAELEPNQAAALAQPAELTANDGEIMNTELLGLAEHRAQARCVELEQEVAALRQALEGLNGSFAEQQTAGPDQSAHVAELEQRLNQQAAELEKQKEEQQRAESELRHQLEEKNAAGQQNEAARQQADARCAQLEKELAALRQASDAAAKKPTEKSEPGQGKPKNNGSSSFETWAGLSASEMEQQVRQGVAALAKATAELAKERGERQRAQQLAADLNGRLQTLHQDFSRTLQVQGEHLSRISALEQETDQAKQALDKAAADVEQHQAERAAAEAELQKIKDANVQLRKDAAFFEEANKRSDAARQDLQGRLETSLNAAREHEARWQQESSERKKLAEAMDSAQRQLQEQGTRHQLLEQELKTANDALQDREARLQKETAERQRLTETLEALQRGSHDGPDRDLEFSKVQSALQSEQVERKRQESQMARMRQSALEAAHAARALRTSLRRQIREPVDNLVHSARSLLELEMGEEQKKLAESVLQDVLMVQTQLREPTPVAHDGAETVATPGKTAA